MAGGIQLCCGKQVSKWVIVRLDHELCTIQVILEFIYHSPFYSQEFQFVSWVSSAQQGLDFCSHRRWAFVVHHVPNKALRPARLGWHLHAIHRI